VADDNRIKRVQFDFANIDRIMSMDVNANTDIIAVIKQAFDVAEIKTKDGRDLKKRDIILVDQCLKE
jgi:hypothetical protein